MIGGKIAFEGVRKLRQPIAGRGVIRRLMRTHPNGFKA